VTAASGVLPGPAIHTRLLALQRLAGNSAVAALLSRPPGVSTLQRCGDEPCACPPAQPGLQRDDGDPTQAGDLGSAGGTSMQGDEDSRGAEPQADYSGLEALASTDTVPPGETVQAVVQRDGDAGSSAAPVRLGTTCVVPTNFTDYFQGTPPRNPRRAALTSYRFTVDGGRITVSQDRGASWVNRDQVTADGQRAGGTTRQIAACRGALRSGSSWYETQPGTACPAAGANQSPHRASTSDECESVVGAGLDADGRTDSVRLLRHEAHHLLLACAIAADGNSRIDRGAQPARIARLVGQTDARLQVEYDNASAHGCDPGGQAAWEQRIDDPASQWLP
jgi:hypothetical protein